MEKLKNEKVPQIEDIRPKSYTLERLKKKKETGEAKVKKVQEIILNAMKYYSLEYPKSTRNLEWENPKKKISVKMGSDVDLFLADCSEEELMNLREMVEYTRRETIKKSSEHEEYRKAGAYIKKLIPGIKYIEKLEVIQKKKDKIQKEIKKYELLIAEERKIFEDSKKERVIEDIEEEIIEVIEEKVIETTEEDESEELEPYRCSMCFPTIHSKGKIYYDHLKYKAN